MSELQSLLTPSNLAIAAVVLLLLLTLRNRGRGSNRRTRPRGPGNARYVCARCSGEFLHSNRTISAWEKGTKRIFCDGCHKQWISKQPPRPNAESSLRTMRVDAHQGASRPSGCFAVVLLVAIIPTVLLYASFTA